MLQLRPQQMQVFEQVAWRRFEDDMVAHSQQFATPLCMALGEEQVRVAVRQTIARARGYGLTCRGPIRLCVELALLFGSSFDTDPQYPWIAPILKGQEPEMERADRLHVRVCDFLRQVHGEDGANAQAALQQFALLDQQPLVFTDAEFVPGMSRVLYQVFPQKAVFLGDRAVRAVIAAGQATAHRYHLNGVPAAALMVLLGYGFGLGCATDPLYPWIGLTLTDERIVDPSARAARLKKKTVTWLHQVIAGGGKGPAL